MGAMATERIHPQDRDKLRMAADKTSLDKVPCDVEFRTLKLDGKIKHIRGIGHPLESAAQPEQIL